MEGKEDGKMRPQKRHEEEENNNYGRKPGRGVKRQNIFLLLVLFTFCSKGK